MNRVKHAAAVVVYALALSLVACAPGIDGVTQALANTASTVAVGYKTLHTVDVAVQGKLREQAKTDPHSAALAMTAYLERYDIARKALDGAAAAIEIVVAAEPGIAKGIAGDKKPADYIADLVSVGLAVTSALAKLGGL